MRFRLFFLIILLFSAVLRPAVAQSDCGEDDFNQQLNDLIAAYETARADDPYMAAQSLQADIGMLLAACGQSPLPQTGLWQLSWLGSDTSQCPGGGPTIGAAARTVVLLADTMTQTFSVADVFDPETLDFSQDETGAFFYRRNVTNGTEVFTVEFSATLDDEGRISGVATAFLPSANCYLETNFELTLADPDLTCLIGTLQGANLRSGPGTEFDRAGTIPFNKEQAIIGQTVGSDNFTWWQISESEWVRSDVVTEAGDCEAVPVMEP